MGLRRRHTVLSRGKVGQFGRSLRYAVAALAGLEVAIEKGLVRRGERVLHVATGNGLKDTRGAMRSVGPPMRISPSLEAVRQALEPSK